jgi:hypothetical protein
VTALEIWRAIYDALLKRASVYLAVVIGSGTAGTIYYLDPFYHSGWFLTYKGYIVLLVVICGFAIYICHWRIGLLVTFALAAIAACAFGVLYQNAEYRHSEWPFWIWFLHLFCACLLVGVLVGGGAQLIHKLNLKQAATERRAKKKDLPAGEV